MAEQSTPPVRTLYPLFRYADVRKAIDWLVTAFGFTEHSVHTEADGSVGHAELVFDTGMIMLGPIRSGVAKPRPEADDWRVYVAVDDVDAHHARALAAGAEIVQELTDQPYGSREYGARDLEGNVWSFGTYRP